MAVLYRGPLARITHEVFEATSPPRHAYPIVELTYVHAVKPTTADATVGSTPVRVCSTALTGAAGIVAVAGPSVLDSPPATVVAIVVLVLAAVLAIHSWRLHRRPREIWAVHNGQLVCLIQTRDQRTFGQIRRALLRALEWIDDTR